MLVDVEGYKGYVYDNGHIQVNKDGAKFANARFDEKRAKELGLSQKEIAEEKNQDKVILVEINE